MKLNNTHCPLCQSKAVGTYSCLAHDTKEPATLSVITCKDCGMAWQYPVLRTQESSQAYFESEYKSAASGSYFDQDSRSQIAKLQLEFLDELAVKTSDLLDVGTGDGSFISAAARQGWNCTGLDPALPADLPYSLMGPGRVALVRGTFDSLGSKLFDVITLWDVIEHVDDPAELLQNAVKVLSSDGILVIETGNYESVDRINGGVNWWCYQADHRWYFSPSTLLPLLRREGFHYCVLASKVFRPWWKKPLTSLKPTFPYLAKNLLRKPHRSLEIMGKYLLLRRAARDWHPWSSMGVFTIAASRRKISFNISKEDIYTILYNDEPNGISE